MACDAQTLINTAYANGYAKLSDRGLLEAIVASACAGGGGGGGSGQIVAYTGVDPNADGVKPTNLNAAAIAVKPGDVTWTWSIAGQNWQ
jgi:hypothetical protein